MIIVVDTDNRDRGLGSTPCRTQTHIAELYLDTGLTVEP